MFIKRINLVLIFVLSFSLMFSVTNSELRKQIKMEKKIIKALEEQIKELRDVANRKVSIKKYSNEGKKDLVQTEFLKDITSALTLLKKKKMDKAMKEFRYISIIYKNRLEVEDLLLYYKGYFYEKNGEMEKSARYYEELISKYPNSKFYQNARLQLAEKYLSDDENEKVINLLNNRKLSTKESFILANSFFNVGNYAAAEPILNELENSEFQFDADFMRGILIYATESIDAAISHYNQLLQKYNPKKTKNYSLIYLNLGRLYAEKEDFANAQNSYNTYLSTLGKKPTVSNEIKYELAYVDWKQNNVENAIKILNTIIETDNGTDVILDSKILLSKILHNTKGYEVAALEIDKSIRELNTVKTALEEKEELTVDTNAIENIELDKIVNELSTTNQLISDKKVGRPTQSFPLIQTMEKNNIKYLKQIKILNEYVQKLKQDNDPTLPDKIGVDSLLANYENPLVKINETLANIDATSIRVLALKLISSKEYIVYDDYLYARFMANEIYQLNEIITLWDKIEKLAKQKNKLAAISKIQSQKKKVQKNIQTLYLLASYRFGEVQDDSQYAVKLQEEYDFMQNKKQELLASKEQVYSTFNKIIAEKLSSKKSELIDEFSKNQNDYINLIESVQNYSDKLVEKYEFSKIDLLYDQAVNLDIKDN